MISLFTYDWERNPYVYFHLQVAIIDLYSYRIWLALCSSQVKHFIRVCWVGSLICILWIYHNLVGTPWSGLFASWLAHCTCLLPGCLCCTKTGSSIVSSFWQITSLNWHSVAKWLVPLHLWHVVCPYCGEDWGLVIGSFICPDWDYFCCKCCAPWSAVSSACASYTAILR